MFFSFKRDRPSAFPAAWLSVLHDNVLLYRTLSAAEQVRLREAVRVLVTRKDWEGCAGQVITDEVKVTIAGQAALLLLGLDGYHFDECNSVLVYPGGFLDVEEDELGEAEEGAVLLGQAARHGPVALSWWHARWAGGGLGSVNVVLHEFAHKLAELGDPEMGCPLLLDPSLRKRWSRVMGAACDRLAEDADYSRPTLFDPYGGESLSEFFAVATETFFLHPVQMRTRHPEVYELLAACYRQDPAQRKIPPEVAAAARGADEEFNRQTVVECTVALARRPDHLDAYEERAHSRAALGDIEGALSDWTALLARLTGAERAETLHERGVVLQRAGRLDEALADFDEAIRLCPDFALAYAARGTLRARRGERHKALEDLNEALRLDKRADVALIERALLHRQAGQSDRALRDLDRAARLSPHDPAIFRQRARLRLERKEFAEALGDCDTADELAGENTNLHERAEALAGLGRDEEARQAREAAERLDKGPA